jgi:hypothetical protein
MSGSRRNSILDVYQGGLRFFANLSSAFSLTLKLNSAPTANIVWTLPSSLPVSTQAIVIDPTGAIAFQPISGGGGTVTNFTASPIFSVTTPTTTPALSLASQAAGLILASPTGAAGVPAFRAIAYSDIAAIVGSTSGTLAVGNDSRFHAQNTDVSTTSVSFQLNSASSGVRIKDASGALQIRNSADTANADLVANNITVNNLTVSGTTTTVNAETVTIADNILLLNSNVVSGTPTEDGGIQISRGASTLASLIWDETGDFWKAGLAASELRVSRTAVVAFTNANITGGQVSIAHGLGNQYPSGVSIYDGNNKLWGSIDDITGTDANTITLDLTSLGAITGTWRCSVTG